MAQTKVSALTELTSPDGAEELLINDGGTSKKVTITNANKKLFSFLDANGNYIQMQKGGDIASASPTVIDTDGDYFICTGTTGFTTFTVAADRHFFLEFAAILTMTHGAGTLDLPGGANITTAASDVGEFYSTASNVVTCVNYTKADGTPIAVNIVDDTSPQLGGFLDANGNYIQTEKGADIASASPTVITTVGDYFDVTGTTNFAAFTVAADRQFTLQFNDILTMTHDGTALDLPGEANITTAAGDVATFQSTAANQVQCISYTRAAGTAVVGSSDLPTAPSGISNDTNKEYNLKLTDVGGTETLTWVEETDDDTTYSTATSSAEGLVKIEDDTEQTVAANTVSATAGKTYGIQLNSSDQAVVNVPWTDTDTDTTYSAGSSSALGLIKLEDDNVQTTAASAITTTSSRTYGLQVNSSGQGVVNVPWSDTDTTNDVVDDTTPQLGGDLDCNGSQIQWSQGADVASATALAVLTDGNYFDVTGTTTITSINTTGGVGTLIKLHFDGILTLTHDATDLILPGGANITTAAGDEAEFIEYATGDYRCTNYSKADGTAVVAAGGGTITALNSATENELVTVGATTTELDAESGLTFDGTNLSIGGASPASVVHIKGGAPVVTIESDTNASSRTWRFATERVAGGDLAFQYGTTLAGTPSETAIRFDADGTVHIGNYNSGGHASGVEFNGAERISMSVAAGSGTHMRFGADQGETGSITTNQSNTSYNTSSDYRLKENVDYTWDATTRLKQLKPARFNFIVDDTNTLVDGFIAHEVSGVVPEAISGEKDAMTTEVLYVEGDELPEGKSIGDVKEASVISPQGIDQSKLVPLLVKTIQELEARITALEAELS